MRSSGATRARAAGGTEYVSAGFGTMGNWVAEYLAAAENIKLNHIAYKGGAQALLDLLAGHVKVGMLTYSAVAGHIRAGKLVPLAVTSADRLPYLPDLPTLRELGHNDFVSTRLVLAVGSGRHAEGYRRRHQPRGRSRRSTAADQAADRAGRDRGQADDAGRTERFAQGEIDRWTPLIKRIMATRTP